MSALSRRSIIFYKSLRNMKAIGIVHSPYKEKFAIPRQPGLVPSAKGFIEFYPPFNQPDCFRGLSDFSHLWIQFVFHQTQPQGWQPLVRPPRLGGNEKKGVFATRSTFRPNSIGLSVVKVDELIERKNTVKLMISGLDLLDQTPVLDIKPYIPYSDSIENAVGGFAQSPQQTIDTVLFSEHSSAFLNQIKTHYPLLASLIKEVLMQDPRPAYQAKREDGREYGMALYEFNIKWRVQGSACEVTEIQYR